LLTPLHLISSAASSVSFSCSGLVTILTNLYLMYYSLFPLFHELSNPLFQMEAIGSWYERSKRCAVISPCLPRRSNHWYPAIRYCTCDDVLKRIVILKRNKWM
jgi:hypothetical protein